jgi:general secretion pathway protein K
VRLGDRAGERGSATIAAVLAAACFAMLAAQMARTSRSAIVGVNAALAHDRLSAAADAGLTLALEGLTSTNPSGQWDLRRDAHTSAFEGTTLRITVEDERGKIPLNTLKPDQVHTLFEKAGAPAEQIQDLVDAFLDFRDPLRLRPREGAEPPATARQGGFETVEEFAQVPGVTPALYAAVLPSITVTPSLGPFEPKTATPLALDVMKGAFGATEGIEREREMAGERTALSADSSLKPQNRALTIRVDAIAPDGAHAEKATVVELTDRRERPYVIRQQDAGFG